MHVFLAEVPTALPRGFVSVYESLSLRVCARAFRGEVLLQKLTVEHMLSEG